MKKIKNKKWFYIAKRFTDLFFAILFLIILLPFFIVTSLIILISDDWPIFFIQERVGKNWSRFKILKFRTMSTDTPKFTIGKSAMKKLIPGGKFLRKFRLDELPQLINVIKNDMSFIGPRPEIEKFARKYDAESKNIFRYKPGITSPASIEFLNEADLLADVENQEKYYIDKIVPKKISIDLDYFRQESFCGDVSIIYRSIKKLKD